MPKSRRRSKVVEAKARQARVDRTKGEHKKLTPNEYARRRALGWSLMGAAILLGISHMLAHVGLLYPDRALMDLLVGYPTAGLLGIAGAIVLS